MTCVAPNVFVRGGARRAIEMLTGARMPKSRTQSHASLSSAGRTNASAPTQEMRRTNE